MTMTRHIRLALLTAATLWISGLTAALAGGYYERDGVAIGGYDPVAYFTEQKPVKGSPEFQSVHRGSTFQFSSAAHRDAFAAEPDKYAPQYGGYFAYGMAKGYKAKIDPAAFSVIHDTLYLNYSDAVRSRWLSDVPGYIQQADANWPAVMTLTKVHE
jgi:YHS domain-containing protein